MRVVAISIRYPNDIFTRQCHSSCMLSHPPFLRCTYLKLYELVGRALFHPVDGTKKGYLELPSHGLHPIETLFQVLNRRCFWDL
jgi:hypothetical protein